MNFFSLHDNDKEVSATKVASEISTEPISIRLLKGALLSKHITMIPALLTCIEGKSTFENEKGEKVSLSPGDYVNITPEVLHWVEAQEDSLLLLLK